MKRTKKLAAALLSLVMALALAVPAFEAGETYSITIANGAEGHTYEAYQIFKGDLNEKTLSNVESVSYTHLDVYKRQPIRCRKDGILSWATIAACPVTPEQPQ